MRSRTRCLARGRFAFSIFWGNPEVMLASKTTWGQFSVDLSLLICIEFHESTDVWS